MTDLRDVIVEDMLNGVAPIQVQFEPVERGLSGRLVRLRLVGEGGRNIDAVNNDGARSFDEPHAMRRVGCL